MHLIEKIQPQVHCGDFKYGDINWKTWTTPYNGYSDETIFVEALRDSYLLQHVERPTRKRGSNGPSPLDLVITDVAMHVSDLWHLSQLGKNDHGLITFNFHAYLDFAKPKDRHTYTNGVSTTRNGLRNTNWSKEFVESGNEKSVEELWGLLKSKLTELRNRLVLSGRPLLEKKGSFPRDKDTREAIKKTSFMDSIQKSKREFVLRKGKRAFERGIARESKTNPKMFWYAIMRKQKTESCTLQILIII